MPCEMCGKEGNLVTADIEGVELRVCYNCAKHGRIKKRLVPAHPPAPRHLPWGRKSAQRSALREKPEFKVVDNYSSLIKSVRERKGMKQEDFAKLLNERESIVAKWESGSLKPGIETAKRVGRKLGINLVEKDEEVMAKIEKRKGKSDVPTLGDFVKVRKRK